MSYVNKYRYGNRPNYVSKLIMGLGINVGTRILGGDGNMAHTAFDMAYDAAYPPGPEFGQSDLANTFKDYRAPLPIKNGSGGGTRSYRVNQLLRRHRRRMGRQMSSRQRLHKRKRKFT